jgi:hypothetical protein
MKKRNLKSLSLNKKSIVNLVYEEEKLLTTEEEMLPLDHQTSHTNGLQMLLKGLVKLLMVQFLIKNERLSRFRSVFFIL